jgi:transketolase
MDFELGRAIVLREGTDATLIGCGRTVADCIVAADLLLREGIRVRVVDMHTIKPIDMTAIRNAAAQTALIVTAEEHSEIGGLGSAVAEVLADLGGAPSLKRVGIPDTYPIVGSQEALLEKYGITASHIVEIVLGNRSKGVY